MKIRTFENLLCVLAMTFAGCSGGDEFRVIGTVENLGTQNLRVVYYTDKALQMQTTTAIDGQFQFAGNAQKETLLEIFTTDRAPLASLLVKNGQTVKLSLDRSEPSDWKVEGSPESKRLADFVKKNAEVLYGGSAPEINSVVSEYVGSNRDDMISTVVMMKYYDATGNETQCDSLFEIISHDARPDYLCEGVRAMIAAEASYDMATTLMPMNLYTEDDSMMVYRPDEYKGSVVAFSDAEHGNRQMLLGGLRKMRKDYDKKQVAVVEISMAEDTAAWHKSIAADSATWVQAWLPGAVASPAVMALRVPRVPYYVVADSTGRLLYRGVSADDASRVMDDYVR